MNAVFIGREIYYSMEIIEERVRPDYHLVVVPLDDTSRALADAPMQRFTVILPNDDGGRIYSDATITVDNQAFKKGERPTMTFAFSARAVLKAFGGRASVDVLQS